MKTLANVKTVCALLVCLVMVLALCACGEPKPSTPETNSTTESTTTTTTTATESTTVSTTSATANSTKKNNTVATAAKPKTPAQLIVGKWRTTMDIAPKLAEAGLAVEGKLMVTCDLEFTKNGVVYEVINRNSLKSAYTTLFSKLIKDSLEQENITETQFQAEYGQTVDEYVAAMVQEAMNAVPQTIISTYKFQGNDLYTRGQDDTDFQKETYSFNGDNKLTLNDGGMNVTYTRL